MILGMVAVPVQAAGPAPGPAATVAPAATAPQYETYTVTGGPALPETVVGKPLPLAWKQRMAQPHATRPSTSPASPAVSDIPLGGSYLGVKSPMDTGPGAPQIDVKGYASCPFGTKPSLMARLKTCSGDMNWYMSTLDKRTGLVAASLTGRILYEHFAYTGKWDTMANVYYRIDKASGLLEGGTNLQPTLACHSCHVDSLAPHDQFLHNGSIVKFVAHLAADGPIYTGTQKGINFTVDTSAYTTDGKVRGYSESPGVSHTLRCQNAMATAGRVGCNVNGVPGLVNYYRAAGSHTAAVGIHIADAWRRWNTNWGDVNTGPPLHRTKSAGLMNSNTNIKNRECAKLIRPTGYQCDEYPFRSTYEGGFNSSRSGYPLDTQFSVKMIPADQNGWAGNELLNVYNAQAISDAEQFYMWVH